MKKNEEPEPLEKKTRSRKKISRLPSPGRQKETERKKERKPKRGRTMTKSDTLYIKFPPICTVPTVQYLIGRKNIN